METSVNESPTEEFYDCLSEDGDFPVRYCAIASPRGRGYGEVFLDFKKAQTKWKEIKGSRMKFFDDFDLAQQFANTPVNYALHDSLYPPSPKADVEATPFSNASQSSLLKFRNHIEKGEFEKIRSVIENNPMTLVTLSDTPTLLQIRLRYNALHVAAAAGSVESIQVIFNFLNSITFWKRIFPNSDEKDARQRQWHVIDLYINSPELGNLETPLHFSSKFGHAACVRILAAHPLTQLASVNRAGQTALEVAATRVTSKTCQKTEIDGERRVSSVYSAVRRALDENFVVLADVVNPKSLRDQVCILPPVSLQQLQTIVARLLRRHPPGLTTLLPFLDFEVCGSQSAADVDDESGKLGIDLKDYGFHGFLRSIRAFAGPMLLSEAKLFHTRWTAANSISSSKEFASIRLADFEKGYERQGRYFARLFGTQWFESWEFLNDYLDLASESGLEVLEEFLNQGNLNLGFLNCEDIRIANSSAQELTTTLESESNCLFEPNGSLSSTPILHRKAVSYCLPNSDNKTNAWKVYRTGSDAAGVLNDSLDGSSVTSDLLPFTDRHLSESSAVDKPVPSTVLSPLVGLLTKLTFTSPLRWLLVDGPTAFEPLFNRDSPVPPHKRPVKIRTSSSFNLSTSPGKRKYDKSGGRSSPASPSLKKPTPESSPKHQQPVVHVPPLFKHICRALPGGDPELDTAAIVAFGTEANPSSMLTADQQPWPSCRRSLSLVKFQTVASWKRQLESHLHFTTELKRT